MYDIIENLPNKPGCYFYKNKNNEIIYIGKSKNIKKRVKSYFGVVKNPKIKKLVQEIRFIDFQITESESDALLLECFLIKKYSPKYNSMLKGDKSFPFIKIDCSMEYPSIRIAYEQDKNSFGFFYSESDAQRTIELIGDVWKMPTCGQAVFKNKRECLRYHLGKCLAPCAQKTEPAEYNKKIQEIIDFFNSKHKKIFSALKKDFKLCMKNLEFEKAENIHINIEKLNYLSKKIKRINTSLNKKNLYLLFRAFNEKELSVFFVKDEKILSRKPFEIDNINKNELENFIKAQNNKEYSLKPDFVKLSHILEIAADKYFIPDKKNLNPEQKADYLLSKIYEFLSLDSF